MTAKTDRRSRRTRERLQKALIELIGERGYNAITIQEIADRADLGRSTFYAHYSTKDDLFMSCHEAIVGEFRPVELHPHPLSREELLALQATPELESAYRHLADSRARLNAIFQGREGPLILRRMRDSSAQEIEANLRAAFADVESTIPFDVLANYLAGAQIALAQWWLGRRRPHTAQDLARAFHLLRRAAIRDAFGLRGEG